MRYIPAAALAILMSAGLQASDPVVSGAYVEARTAEVFTGGCIMGSEGEVSGRQAIMAWRIDRGSMYGVPLEGLSVVAVVAADTNLGMHELGGQAPSAIRSIVLTDERATAAQQQALVALARSMAPDVVKNVVETRKAPITFTTAEHRVQVAADAARIDVVTDVEHSPDCGAVRWFDPLAATTGAKVGLARSHEWSGRGLGSQWRQNERRSAFVGTFRLGAGQRTAADHH